MLEGKSLGLEVKTLQPLLGIIKGAKEWVYSIERGLRIDKHLYNDGHVVELEASPSPVEITATFLQSKMEVTPYKMDLYVYFALTIPLTFVEIGCSLFTGG